MKAVAHTKAVVLKEAVVLTKAVAHTKAVVLKEAAVHTKPLPLRKLLS